MSYVSKKMQNKTPYEPITGDYILRLDANESPLNISEEILTEFCDKIKTLKLNRYPDPSSRKVREAFAKRFDVCAENVIASNGSDEIISVIMTSLLDSDDKLCVAYPDFSMYEFYAKLCENEVVVYGKENDFSLKSLSDFVNENNIRAVIFSNPCNPTSTVFQRADVISFIENTHALCIVDEAYMDFANESILDVSDKYENLLVLKTLSKAFGAAGIRLGFTVGHKSLIDALNVARSPYNVNSLTQLMGEIILEKAPDNSKLLAAQAKKLENKLCELLPQATINSTDANFVYLKHEKAKKIFEYLKNNKIAVRYFNPDRLRITTSTDDELEYLYKTLQKMEI